MAKKRTEEELLAAWEKKVEELKAKREERKAADVTKIDKTIAAKTQRRDALSAQIEELQAQRAALVGTDVSQTEA